MRRLEVDSNGDIDRGFGAHGGGDDEAAVAAAAAAAGPPGEEEAAELVLWSDLSITEPFSSRRQSWCDSSFEEARLRALIGSDLKSGVERAGSPGTDLSTTTPGRKRTH